MAGQKSSKRGADKGRSRPSRDGSSRKGLPTRAGQPAKAVEKPEPKAAEKPQQSGTPAAERPRPPPQERSAKEQRRPDSRDSTGPRSGRPFPKKGPRKGPPQRGPRIEQVQAKPEGARDAKNGHAKANATSAKTHANPNAKQERPAQERPEPQRTGPRPPPAPRPPPKARKAAGDESVGPQTARSGHVAIVGRPNVGKSTLLNGMVGEHVSIVSHHAQTTRDRVVGVVSDGAMQIALIDTPGLHSPRNKLGTRMNRQVQGAMDAADVIVFVSDVAEDARPDFHPQDAALIAALPTDKPVLLVVNKIDRVKIKAALMPLLATRSAAFAFAAVIPVSAMRRHGLDRLRQEIDSRLPEGEKIYDDETFSDRPARFFVQEYVREQVLRLTREEVPHGVAVTVERWDEGGKILNIDVTIHVDKENHKRIVIGEGGSVLKEVGSRARGRIEQLLDRQVMLKCWVRVTPRWYESDKLLNELGYAGASE